jgi:LDH2 family malate/lactate/ureidoglycolate dehydrogenase
MQKWFEFYNKQGSLPAMAYRIDPDKIKKFCQNAFQTFQVCEKDSETIADNLVQAELR